MSPNSRFTSLLTAAGFLAVLVIAPSIASAKNRMHAVDKVSEVHAVLIGVSSCLDQLEEQLDKADSEVVYWLRDADGIVRFTVSPAISDETTSAAYSGRVENYRGDVLFRRSGKVEGEDLDEACEAATREFAEELNDARD